MITALLFLMSALVGLPDLLKIPDDLYDRTSDRIKKKLYELRHIVRGGEDLDLGELPNDPEFQDQTDRYNRLAREIIARAPTPEDVIQLSHTSMTTTRTVPADGRTKVVPGDDTEFKVVERTFDVRGEQSIEEDVVEPEAIAASRSWIDRRQHVRDLQWQASELNRLAGQVGEQSLSAADEVRKKATEKRD
jgi:hypothetical protein